MTYDEAVKSMKDKHSEFSKVGREYRELQVSTREFAQRAIDAIVARGLAKKVGQSAVIKCTNIAAEYHLMRSSNGVECYLTVTAPYRSTEYLEAIEKYPRGGNIKTLAKRLKKVDDLNLRLKITDILDVLEKYSE